MLTPRKVKLQIGKGFISVVFIDFTVFIVNIIFSGNNNIRKAIIIVIAPVKRGQFMEINSVSAFSK